MTDKILALFSSDSRELYKADVYRVLALPPGYCLQLRYRRKHIDGAALAKINTLVGKQGIIFFVAGNDLSKPKHERTLTLTSLRAFEVVEILEDANIETFNFYVKLGKFADATPHPQTALNFRPTQAFVSELSVDHGPNGTWMNRVTAIAPHFPNITFLFVNGIYRGQKPVPSTFNKDSFASEFLLDEESRYKCRMTLHDPTVRPTGLSTFNTSTAAQLNVPADHRLGTQNESAIFEIQTNSLQQREVACSSYLWDRCGKPEPEAWKVELRWRVRRGRAKAVMFGVLMAASAAGVAVAKVATDRLSTTPISMTNWALAILGGVIIAVYAGWLYEFFNKK